MPVDSACTKCLKSNFAGFLFFLGGGRGGYWQMPLCLFFVGIICLSIDYQPQVQFQYNCYLHDQRQLRLCKSCWQRFGVITLDIVTDVEVFT